MKPLNFKEFLNALDEKSSLDIINNTMPAPDFAHEKLMKFFHVYSIIGGMPEIVRRYSEQQDIFALNNIFDSLIVSCLVIHLRCISSIFGAGKKNSPVLKLIFSYNSKIGIPIMHDLGNRPMIYQGLLLCYINLGE